MPGGFILAGVDVNTYNIYIQYSTDLSGSSYSTADIVDTNGDPVILDNQNTNTFKYINTKIVNTQQIYINDIITFIKGNDYFGDDYHKYKTYQLNFTKWWIMTFFPPSVNIYNKNKEELGTLFKSTQEKNKLECAKFLENIF